MMWMVWIAKRTTEMRRTAKLRRTRCPTMVKSETTAATFRTGQRVTL